MHEGATPTRSRGYPRGAMATVPARPTPDVVRRSRSGVPERTMVTQVPTFSSSVNYFVVVAPATKHVVTCLTCDRASFHARVWCRAEVMACWARNGTSHMYLSTSRGIEKLFAGGEADPLLADALDVFGGNLTCCRLGHPGAQPCDREALVPVWKSTSASGAPAILH